MLASLPYRPKDMRIENVNIPKIRKSAVCGTDIKMFNHGYEGIKNNTRVADSFRNA